MFGSRVTSCNVGEGTWVDLASTSVTITYGMGISQVVDLTGEGSATNRDTLSSFN